MDATAYLAIAMYVTAIVVLIVAGWGVVQVVDAARSVRRVADELHATVPGVIERADETLTAFNAELIRMDGVVAQLEEVADRVTNTTRAAQEMVDAAGASVTGLAAGARRFFEVLLSKRPRRSKNTQARS